VKSKWDYRPGYFKPSGRLPLSAKELFIKEIEEAVASRNLSPQIEEELWVLLRRGLHKYVMQRFRAAWCEAREREKTS
jgi:hypothetical protein